MPLIKLTEKRAANAPIKSKPYQLRDSALPGFFVGISPGGARAWKVQVELRRPDQPVRTIRKTIGRVGVVALDDARLQATQLIAQVRAGEDPRPKPAERGPSMWTLAQAYEQYAAGLLRRGKAQRTADDMLYRFGRHLTPWAELPLTAITPLMVRELHGRIPGERCSNQTIIELGSVWRRAQTVFPEQLIHNPCSSVELHKIEQQEKSIANVAAWWSTLDALPNPLRREMFRLGLLSGLRPGNLCSIRLEWISSDRITFPKAAMKARRQFELPLSTQMVEIVERARGLATMFAPSTPWLFPTRDSDGKLTHTTTWQDRKLGKEVGHTIRHTYNDLALEAGLADSDTRLLMAHAIAGIGRVYTSERALFPRKLRLQQVVSDHIMARVSPAGATQ